MTREPDRLSRIADALADGGLAVVADFLDANAVAVLRAHAGELAARDALQPAAVGRSTGRVQVTGVRGDRILWLDEHAIAPAEQPFVEAMRALRDVLNRELMLGLVRLEAHYALYPPGAAYARHRDRFRDDDARALSCVLYLNEAWSADDGGALRLYLDDGVRDVLPEGGTLVTFLSERFEHEVLPARRPRLALTGWWRRRE